MKREKDNGWYTLSRVNTSIYFKPQFNPSLIQRFKDSTIFPQSLPHPHQKKNGRRRKCIG
jgi:hypothetical protein